MHYINGREAKVGDPILILQYNAVRAGAVVSISPNAATCNARVAYPVMGGMEQTSATLGTEVLHAEDAWNAAIPILQPTPPSEPA